MPYFQIMTLQNKFLLPNNKPLIHFIKMVDIHLSELLR